MLQVEATVVGTAAAGVDAGVVDGGAKTAHVSQSGANSSLLCLNPIHTLSH